ncbi:hypothetical protein [Oceanobacillus sp. J11TS1]|uniref:hypothetical protein n=1 Tax=Oceanobacillus sp. J11TS1 TaxID=2807191 RepID=UPI001B0CC0B9|nr:hypothetical protein [Oceanobacillus sp. J11TS1]GIO23023.1 hypothetical protein J11TS1_16040 [Oceanobacillus sp. J11TS1]
MDFLVILFLGLNVIMVLIIGTLLYQLSKSGDERKEFIKMKTMADTFLITVGVLLIDTVVSFVNDGTATNSPIIFLFVIAIVFLISLLINKRKFGD